MLLYLEGFFQNFELILKILRLYQLNLKNGDTLIRHVSFNLKPRSYSQLYPTETISYSGKILTNENYATHVCMLLQIDWHQIALKIPAIFLVFFFFILVRRFFLFADPNLSFIFHPLDFINMPHHSVRPWA